MIEKCPTAGCWFRLRDSTGVIKVDTKSAGFVVVDVPLEAKITVAGRVLTDGNDAQIEATGIQKGGLYRHFGSREELAHEAFDFAVAQIRDRFFAAIERHTNACDRLLALLASYDGDTLELPLPGGCPIMNGAIESDHADAALRQRASEAMSAWHGLVCRIVQAGIRAGEIRRDVKPADVASFFIASIEGAVMLTHLHGDTAHWQAVRRQLQAFVERGLRASPGVSP